MQGNELLAGSPLRVALAPTYDHASSLGRNETDERRRLRMTTNDRGAGVEAFCARARSAFYGDPDIRKTITTLDAFAAASRLRSAAAAYLREQLARLGSADFDGILRAVPQGLISVAAVEFALRMLDLQNPNDPSALLMRTADPISIVGYSPRFYSAEFSKLIGFVGQDKVEVTVAGVNPDAPLQFRLRCRLSAPWPAGFTACSDDVFKSLG